MTLGVAKEQSARGAAALEKASGQSSQSDQSRVKIEEEVRRLRDENKQSKGKGKKCSRCGKPQCTGGTKCPANGQKCGKCHKLNHFAKVCRSKKQTDVSQLSSAEDSDSSESSGRVIVGKVGSGNIGANIYVSGPEQSNSTMMNLATDTGVSKTVLNRPDWVKVRSGCKFVKTSKRFRPYGTAYHLPIKGKSEVYLTSENGARIKTWVYVNDDPREQSLLGERDARRLGIVHLNLRLERGCT